MLLRLHPAPQQGVGGFVTFGHDAVPQVTRHLWEIMEHGSADYFPLAKYDLDDDGRMRVAVIPGHVGPAADAEREVGALRRCAVPISDATRAMSYLDLVDEIEGGGSTSGPVPAPPRRQAWELYQFPFGADAQAQMDLLLEQVAGLAGPSPQPFLSLWRSVAPDTHAPACAAPLHHGIAMFIASYWSDPADDDEQVRRVEEIAARFVDSGLVTEAANAMNHVAIADDARVRRVYGDEAYERLARLKATYDPDNRLRRNCNIPPAR